MEGPRIIDQLVAGNQELVRELTVQLREQGHVDVLVIIRDFFACLLCKQRFPERIMMLPAVLDAVWRMAVLETSDYAKLCSKMGGLFIPYSRRIDRDTILDKKACALELIKTHFELFNGTLSTVGPHWALPAESTAPVVDTGKKRLRQGEYVTIVREDGTRFTIELVDITRVDELKDRIFAVTGMRIYEQLLVYNGRTLVGDAKLDAFGVAPNAVLHLGKVFVRG